MKTIFKESKVATILFSLLQIIIIINSILKELLTFLMYLCWTAMTCGFLNGFLNWVKWSLESLSKLRESQKFTKFFPRVWKCAASTIISNLKRKKKNKKMVKREIWWINFFHISKIYLRNLKNSKMICSLALWTYC